MSEKNVTVDRWLEDLQRDGFSFAAWRRFLGRAWSHSRHTRKAAPKTRRAFLLAFGAGAALTLLLSWTLCTAEPNPTVSVPLTLLLGGGSFLLASGWVWIHLGLSRHDGKPKDTNQHAPRASLGIPNILSYWRLAFAGFACLVVSYEGHAGFRGPLWGGFLIVLALSDLLDGVLARHLDQTTRLGRFLDPLADVVFLTALALGLLLGRLLPLWVFVLLTLRYVGTFLFVFIFVFRHGGLPIRPTLLGRVTTVWVSVVLVGTAIWRLMGVPPFHRGIALVAIWSLAAPLTANLVYLVARATRILSDSNNR